jgi:hypothetical protein
MPRKSLLVLLSAVLFCSCYYPAQVVIHNKSGTDKEIRVAYPAGHRTIAATDSLLAYDHTLTANAFSTRDYYRHALNIPIINLDTVNRTFSFFLKDKQQVIPETSWPVSTLPWGQSFIIGGVDTVVLKRRGKDFKRKGGSWTHTIK